MTTDKQIITVAQLNAYIKELLDQEPNVPKVLVRGEISNYRPHPSGHMYFSLKDGEASVSAVMFRGDAYRLRFKPENGMQVLVSGRVSLFVKSGQFQIYVNEMHPEGAGDLFVAFEQMKKKLEAEGLFDPSKKKPIPAYPRRIGLVTAPSGAAVRDMIRILRARWPAAEILLFPVLVQGPDAAADIASAIRRANALRAADVLLVGRGGGSAEDLWAFNEEPVARAIFDSEIPVISGVGHEPDVTIADLAADLRAATPSNAAELATPDREELARRVGDLSRSLQSGETAFLRQLRSRLEALTSTRVMQSPTGYIDERRMVLDHLRDRLAARMTIRNESARRRLTAAAATLNAVSPLAVLGRGYAIPTKEGRAVRSAGELAAGDALRVQFSEGAAQCIVKETEM